MSASPVAPAPSHDEPSAPAGSTASDGAPSAAPDGQTPTPEAIDAFCAAALARGVLTVEPADLPPTLVRRFDTKPVAHRPQAVALYSVFGMHSILDLTTAAESGRYRISADGTALRFFLGSGRLYVTYQIPDADDH